MPRRTCKKVPIPAPLEATKRARRKNRSIKHHLYLSRFFQSQLTLSNDETQHHFAIERKTHFDNERRATIRRQLRKRPNTLKKRLREISKKRGYDFGSFGYVKFLLKLNEKGEPQGLFRLKIYFSNDDKTANYAQTAAYFYQILGHETYCYTNNKKFYLVMPDLGKDNLAQFITNARLPPSASTQLNLMKRYLTDIQHLHNQRFIHCDIKAQNAVVTQNEKGEPVACRLIDFDFAKQVGVPTKSGTQKVSCNDHLNGEEAHVGFDHFSFKMMLAMTPPLDQFVRIQFGTKEDDEYITQASVTLLEATIPARHKNDPDFKKMIALFRILENSDKGKTYSERRANASITSLKLTRFNQEKLSDDDIGIAIENALQELVPNCLIKTQADRIRAIIDNDSTSKEDLIGLTLTIEQQVTIQQQLKQEYEWVDNWVLEQASTLLTETENPDINAWKTAIRESQLQILLDPADPNYRHFLNEDKLDTAVITGLGQCLHDLQEIKRFCTDITSDKNPKQCSKGKSFVFSAIAKECETEIKSLKGQVRTLPQDKFIEKLTEVESKLNELHAMLLHTAAHNRNIIKKTVPESLKAYGVTGKSKKANKTKFNIKQPHFSRPCMKREQQRIMRDFKSKKDLPKLDITYQEMKDDFKSKHPPTPKLAM